MKVPSSGWTRGVPTTPLVFFLVVFVAMMIGVTLLNTRQLPSSADAACWRGPEACEASIWGAYLAFVF